MEKMCCTCKLTISLAEFHKAKSRPDGLSPRCKSCTKKACADSYKRRMAEDEGYAERKRIQSRRTAAKARAEKLTEVQKTPNVKCKSCGILKARSEFPRSKKHLSGHTETCLRCAEKKNRKSIRDRKRKHYLKYKDKINRHRREKLKKNPSPSTRPTLTFSKWLRQKYSMTPGDYLKILKRQCGCCAICKRHFSEFQKRLAVDHDHKTGEVRGLLCSTCNQCLGAFGDDIEGIRRVVNYLENPPAQLNQ